MAINLIFLILCISFLYIPKISLTQQTQNVVKVHFFIYDTVLLIANNKERLSFQENISQTKCNIFGNLFNIAHEFIVWSQQSLNIKNETKTEIFIVFSQQILIILFKNSE